MVCGLREESVQNLERKQKKKKKEKIEKKRKKKHLIVAKSGLVGIKRSLNTYNHVKFF